MRKTSVRVMPIQSRLGTCVFLVIGGTFHGSQVICRTMSRDWHVAQRSKGHFATLTGPQFADLLREVGVVHDGTGLVATEVVDAVASFLANSPQEGTVSAVSSGILTASGWVPSTYTKMIGQGAAAEEEGDELCAAMFPAGVRGRLSLRQQVKGLQ